MQQKKFDEVKQLKKSKSDVVLLETSNKSINPTSMSAKEYKQVHVYLSLPVGASVCCC